MDEVLVTVIDHAEKARQSQSGLEIGVQLKMASRALRCALEMVGERLEEKVGVKEFIHD